MFFMLALLALVAILFLLTLTQPLGFFRQLLHDVRGQMGNMANVALADRPAGCNLPRIPTGRHPPYSQTLKAVVAADGTAVLELPAERDYLFIGLSVSSSDPDDSVTGFVDMSYCNTKYLIHSAIRQWSICCRRKPVFLVGVKDTKKLEFKVSGFTAGATAKITVHGFQGKNCCD